MRKLVLKVMLPVLVFLYRSSGGRIGGTMNGAKVLLLTTRGRKSGKSRTVPLIYIRDGESYVVTASNGGAANHPAWFLNVGSNPQVRLQVKDRQMGAVAEVASREQRQLLWKELLQIAPFFANYQKQVQREIAMVILRPTDVC